MDIENYIKTIVEMGSNEDMHEMSDIFDDTLETIKKLDDRKYRQYKMRLYKIAYGNVLNQQMADEIVMKMKPFGMRWQIEETKNLQRQYGLEQINDIDFYVVINSAYNDYKDVLGDNIENYMKFTLDFIQDEDAVNDKVFLYFTTIPIN